MSNHPDDDLFSSSTMSFGEHIEELRGSLFRALIGLAAGLVVGFIFANRVVEFIQTPLTDALTIYFGEKAREELQQKYGGEAPPEMLNMIDKQGKIPDTLEFDPFTLLEALRHDYPGQFGDFKFKQYLFVPGDVGLSGDVNHVTALSRAIVSGETAAEDSPQWAVWDVLSDAQREQIQRLADRDTATTEDRSELIVVLNNLIEHPTLHQSAGFAAPGFLNSLESHVRIWVDKLSAGLSETFNAEQSRRLNRLLVASLYDDYIRAPHQDVVQITLWKPKRVRVQTLNAQEAFMIWIKAAIITGLVIASPWIFWQVWIFVAAGLYPHERKYVWIFLPFSVLLFMAGAGLAFFFVFKPVLGFLFQFNKAMNIDPDPRISEWLGFVLFLPVGFGISFQLPLVMLFLNRIGIFTVGIYVKKWRIAILVIFVLSMLLTPADPISMLLMAVPLTTLYFGGIALCQWMPKIRRPYKAEDET